MGPSADTPPNPTAAAPAATPPAPAPPKPPANPAASAPPPPAPPPPRSGDLSDSGASVRDSVRARSWRIQGRARASKELEVDELHLEGDLAVGGKVIADRCEVKGRLSAAGEGRGTGAWGLDGETRLGGALHVGALAVQGRLDVRGELGVTGALQVAGSLDVQGAVSASSIHLDGSVAATGAVAAPEAAFVIRGPSKLAALHTRRLTVTRPAAPWDSEPPVLDVLEIEAEEARLAGVVARYVKAARISIGPGCRITEIDGAVVAQSPRSHVGPQVKSPRPKGLWE